MRTDIRINLENKDIPLIQSEQGQACIFRWIDRPEYASDSYIYGEIETPIGFTIEQASVVGMRVEIPYTPSYQDMMLRIRRGTEDNNRGYFNNIVNQDYVQAHTVQENGLNEFFLVRGVLCGREFANIKACELPLFAQEKYLIVLKDGYAQVYSPVTSDFEIRQSDNQNSALLLRCNAGNNYRYPTTGVGLIKWLNSSGNNSTQLAERIQQEFAADGVVVRSASLDYDSLNLELDIIPTD